MCVWMAGTCMSSVCVDGRSEQCVCVCVKKRKMCEEEEDV